MFVYVCLDDDAYVKGVFSALDKAKEFFCDVYDDDRYRIEFEKGKNNDTIVKIDTCTKGFIESFEVDVVKSKHDKV